MYQEDYLLRQIKDLVRALSQASDDTVDLGVVDEALHRTLGLTVSLLDRLDAHAIVPLLRRGDAFDAQRLCLVADALVALARDDTALSRSRRAKAEELRAAALE